MVTLALAVLFACGAFAAAYFAVGLGMGWSIFLAVVAFGLFQIVVGRRIQRAVKGEMDAVQAILADGQKRLQAKMQRWQMRPPGSIQEAQRQVMADTRVFVGEAIARTDSLARFRLWVPMMDRQIATAKLQLNWMIKEFKAVDALMPKALFLDPTMSAIRLARLYMTDARTEEIAKVYAKAARRLKYNQNVLLAATWSWILVRRGDADGAFKALTEALRNSDDATLKRNHEELMNNRVAHFNNSGLGDQWYALHLEEPKVRMQRQRSFGR